MVARPGEDLVAVGTLQRPFGCFGEIRVTPLTRHIERFARLAEVTILCAGREPYFSRVERVTFRRDIPYLKLAGIDSLEAARGYCGGTICVAEEERLKLPAGEYFLDDLVGMTVYTEDGKTVGVLTDVLSAPAHDLYVVQGEREHLIPAVATFIREVDVRSKRMVVSPPEGLLEL